LGCSRWTVERRVKNGEIPASCLPGGSPLRIRRSDLERSLVPVRDPKARRS
jgi:excisionase family DNA binding protein